MATTTKRKAAPRKVSKATNGSAPHSNGHAVSPEPEAVVPATPDPEPTFSLYGDKQTYRFQPADGDEIVFPHISEVQADAYFFWKIYELNEMFQAFEWMNLAQVPRWVQEQVMKLPDDEKRQFFAGWFSAVVQPQGVAPPGES